MPHLLVAEDDPAISHVIKALLAYGGMSCDVVACAVESLAGRRGSRYSVLLIDLGVPTAERLAVIRSIRAQFSIPVIAITGRAEEEDKIQVLDAGADDVVLKPFFPGELLARIRSLLRRSGYGWAPAA
jgi:DNA-binding response OmpR family regulator